MDVPPALRLRNALLQARGWPDVSPRLRRLRRASALLHCAAAALTLAAGPARAQAAAASAAVASGWWAAVLVATLLLAAMAGWLLFRLRALARALQGKNVEAQAIGELLDVWHWRTDAQHRLQWLRPPAGADNAAWHALPRPVPAWECFLGDDAPALRARLEARSPLSDVPAQLPAGETAARRVSLRAVVLSDADGLFAGHLGTARELPPPPVEPPAAPALAAADPAAAEAEPADRSDSESFSYTVSHDLRAPIRVVEGFTRIVKEDYGRLLDRIGNDHLDRVLGAAARMNSMIDALLALSQLSARPLARQPVNLSQLAAFVADDLRRQWPQREVDLHIEAGMLVSGDPTLLRVMLENLLGNAWKYTGKCRAPEIWFERDLKQKEPTFIVRDNGAGFDMRFADRLFGVFQRLHSANDFQGTGVGLASVRRIVRRHGGEIWAESEVDRGAAFHFSLPSA